VLQFYLERSLPPGTLPARSVQDAYEHLADPVRLESLLEALDSQELEHVLSRLEDYEDQFPPEVVEPALPVLMNQQDRLREGRGQGMFDGGADLALSRVALRLLRRVPEETERDRIVQSVLPRIHRLSARLDLIDTAGHRENVGSKLISEAVWHQSEDDVHRATLESTPQDLAEERDLYVLLFRSDERADERERLRLKALVSTPQLVMGLLRSGLNEGFSQTLGEAAQTAQWRLPWDDFERIFEKDAWEAAVTSALAASERPDERMRTAAETARRYLSGWRPGRRRFPWRIS